jgi:replicative DNA helicase
VPNYVHCTREEYANGIPLNEKTDPPTYVHRLKEGCRCGVFHQLGKVVRAYDYNDNGTLVQQVVRYDPKNFRPRIPRSDGGWRNVLPEKRLIYNLDAVRAADGEYICYCEGEKDADTCSQHGLTATTHAGGASGWRSEFAAEFVGKKVVLLPHNDDASRRMVQEQVRDLSRTASEVKVVALPGLAEHGDVTDWFSAGGTVAQLGDLVNAATVAVPTQDGSRSKIVPAGDWILKAPVEVPAIWGQGQVVLWSKGEPFVVAGPTGIGKGTMLQQVALRRAGLIRTTLFGLPIEVDKGLSVYLALDRPHQIRRSFARMVEEKDLVFLNSKLLVWHGQLPFNLSTHPDKFAAFLTDLGVTTVYIDSLKDAFLKLNSDEGGSAVQYAFSEAISAGIEVAASHHMRKRQGDDSGPRRIDDVYGSQMITAGAGSVVLLWGDPGDLVIEIRHLKQPAEQFLDASVLHDKTAGTLELSNRPDLHLLVKNVKTVTAKDVASHLFGKKNPSRNEIEKARYKLEGMVKAGEAKKVAHPTDKAGKDEVTYSVSDLVYLKSETSPSAIQTKSETKSDTSLGGGESDKSDEAPK